MRFWLRESIGFHSGSNLRKVSIGMDGSITNEKLRVLTRRSIEKGPAGVGDKSSFLPGGTIHPKWYYGTSIARIVFVREKKGVCVTFAPGLKNPQTLLSLAEFAPPVTVPVPTTCPANAMDSKRKPGRPKGSGKLPLVPDEKQRTLTFGVTIRLSASPSSST
eukprot:338630-Prymnesium_polylepis.1